MCVFVLYAAIEMYFTYYVSDCIRYVSQYWLAISQYIAMRIFPYRCTPIDFLVKNVFLRLFINKYFLLEEVDSVINYYICYQYKQLFLPTVRSAFILCNDYQWLLTSIDYK